MSISRSKEEKKQVIFAKCKNVHEKVHYVHENVHDNVHEKYSSIENISNEFLLVLSNDVFCYKNRKFLDILPVFIYNFIVKKTIFYYEIRGKRQN